MSNRRKTGKFVIAVAVLGVVACICVSLAAGKKLEKELGISDRFHYETSLTWRGVLGGMFRDRPKKPPQYKSYPDSKKVALPKPQHHGIAFEEAVSKRRSVRNYSKKAISPAQLSQLLFAAQGVTGKIYGQPLRAAPSAGALYPFEIYVVVNNVEDLAQGIYHYSVLDHSLELVKEGDFRGRIVDAGLKQDMLGDSGVTFILSAVFDRIRCKYGQRGLRYIYMEAGHLSQNIYLQAVSLGLGSVSVGAFLDEQVNKLIEVDGSTEAAVYLHAVGSL